MIFGEWISDFSQPARQFAELLSLQNLRTQAADRTAGCEAWPERSRWMWTVKLWKRWFALCVSFVSAEYCSHSRPNLMSHNDFMYAILVVNEIKTDWSILLITYSQKSIWTFSLQSIVLCVWHFWLHLHDSCLSFPQDAACPAFLLVEIMQLLITVIN